MDNNLSLSSQENYKRLYISMSCSWSSWMRHGQIMVIPTLLSIHMLAIIKFIDPNSYDHPLCKTHPSFDHGMAKADLLRWMSTTMSFSELTTDRTTLATGYGPSIPVSFNGYSHIGQRCPYSLWYDMDWGGQYVSMCPCLLGYPGFIGSISMFNQMSAFVNWYPQSVDNLRSQKCSSSNHLPWQNLAKIKNTLTTHLPSNFFDSVCSPIWISTLT